MIRRIYVDNYKCLVNFELKLQPLTVLVGPNGAGKTAVLEVLAALRELLRGQVRVNDRAAFPASSLTRWQNRRQQVFELEVGIQGSVLRYRLVVEHDPPERGRILEERLDTEGKPLFLFREGTVQLYRDDHTEGPGFPADWSWSDLARVPPSKDNRRLVAFQEFMRNLTISSFIPMNFRAESHREEPSLSFDGSNFASWYRHCLQEAPSRIADLQKRLAEAIPGLQAIRLEKVGAEARAFKIAFADPAGQYELCLDEISDGQRVLVALYTLLEFGDLIGSAMVLDEPDNYLALAEIQPWLMELVDRCGTVRLPLVIICSHHPEVIDYLGPDHGVYLWRDSNGPTLHRPLREAIGQTSQRWSEILARGWQET
ncbi:MAG: AAA family ATPase [Thermoguttaceae bacterium]|nr:AAA family ATPase [Thermoguttaceae bacterium]MDW8079979.1 AAA family ATPase [Thermoguttaceae bacterium]